MSKTPQETRKAKPNRYSQIIEHIFFRHYKNGMTEVPWSREEIGEAGKTLKIDVPKNFGDNLYTYRFRAALPDKVRATAAEGMEWIISLAGRSKYKFVLVKAGKIIPTELLVATKVPEATPGVIDLYALGDEQSLLAKLHYNRLIDLFLGIACYRMQSHLRTQVKGIGQVETDELYVGVDKRGVHYIIPVQAKGGKDKLSIVQVEQDVALCEEKWGPRGLVCLPVAAQFMSDDVIALFSFTEGDEGWGLSAEAHYKLIPKSDMDENAWAEYQQTVNTDRSK